MKSKCRSRSSFHVRSKSRSRYSHGRGVIVRCRSDGRRGEHAAEDGARRRSCERHSRERRDDHAGEDGVRRRTNESHGREGSVSNSHESDVPETTHAYKRNDNLWVHPLIERPQVDPATSLLGFKEISSSKSLTSDDLERLWKAHCIRKEDYKFHLPFVAGELPDLRQGEVVVYLSQFQAGMTLPLDPLERVITAMGTSISLLPPKII